jgi:transcriptional regulator with XRE-family HTH domain
MGRSARPRPVQLAGKLLRIRLALGLSQESMAERLSIINGILHSSVSGYELGTREPPLPVLLEYAKLANVYLDVLADDDLDLPEKIPAVKKSEGIRRSAIRKVKHKS